MTDDEILSSLGPRQIRALISLSPEPHVRGSWSGEPQPHEVLRLTRTEFAEFQEWELIHGKGYSWGLTPRGCNIAAALAEG